MIYFISFLFLFHQLLAPVAGKKNKFVSFREQSPVNHTQFQTKMFKIYTRLLSGSKTIRCGAAHTYIPDMGD